MRDRIAELEAERDSLQRVVDAAIAWREAYIGFGRSTKREFEELCAAIDAYEQARAAKEKKEQCPN